MHGSHWVRDGGEVKLDELNKPFPVWKRFLSLLQNKSMIKVVLLEI